MTDVFGSPDGGAKDSLGFEPGSYRDRSARVLLEPDGVYRALSPRAAEDWTALRQTRFFEEATRAGRLISTVEVDEDEARSRLARLAQNDDANSWQMLLHHQRVPFISYPYEWSFGMLRAAATLQLELLEAALHENMILKDGSAYNVQFQGLTPVFIDVPSFAKMPPQSAWTGYRQFCQLCLYPLFLQAYKDVRYHPWLRGNLDGITPEECRQLMSWRDCLRPGVFTHVVMHALLAQPGRSSARRVQADLAAAGFDKSLILANARQLRRLVTRLSWKPPARGWSRYTRENSYSDTDHERKIQFVTQVLSQQPRKLVWDLGCNTGEYTRVAAQHADYVIAVDNDHATVDNLFRASWGTASSKILPLVINLADSSPGQGWRGQERQPLEQRGQPDFILALALIHHLVIGANIPLREWLFWLAQRRAEVVLEFVGRDDPMTIALLERKQEPFADYSQNHFERWLNELFHVRARLALSSGTRFLYHLQPRTSTV